MIMPLEVKIILFFFNPNFTNNALQSLCANTLSGVNGVSFEITRMRRSWCMKPLMYFCAISKASWHSNSSYRIIEAAEVEAAGEGSGEGEGEGDGNGRGEGAAEEAGKDACCDDVD